MTLNIENTSLLSVNPQTVNASCANCADGAVELIVSGGRPPYAFEWSTGDTTRTLENLEPGNYHVSVSDADTCEMHHIAHILFTTATSSVSAYELSLSPNPSYNTIYIQTNYPQAIQWELIDTYGRILQVGLGRKLDRGDWPAGAYWLRIKSGVALIGMEKVIWME